MADRLHRVLKVNGPLVTAHLPGTPTGEQVRLGTLNLTGEIIAREGDRAIVQVYENTESLRPGDPVEPLGYPLSVELGPGLLGNIFDGVQRPLAKIRELHGDHVPRGLNVPPLDRERSWHFVPCTAVEVGTLIDDGIPFGQVEETPTITHNILVPPGRGGEVIELAPEGDYKIMDVVARVRTAAGEEHELTLLQRWPVRVPRPYRRRDHSIAPLLTGQRMLDTFFPLLKGGKAAIPGPFGAGKTMVQQQIARWSNADIVIYVGCGERGNELVDILETFPELTDPHSSSSLMERTLLVANTSNMPVVAREASIYVGVTLAEYYRDQGYRRGHGGGFHQPLGRGIARGGGRLGKMPVEEGYPAYLGSRLPHSMNVQAGSSPERAPGSVSLIGAVSPPGGDFSEPVTSHTKEIIQTASGRLSKELADARHYPAVSWTESFSGYVKDAAEWWRDNIDPRWQEQRALALFLLAQAEELARIVNLVGAEALSPLQRWNLETAAW